MFFNFFLNNVVVIIGVLNCEFFCFIVCVFFVLFIDVMYLFFINIYIVRIFYLSIIIFIRLCRFGLCLFVYLFGDVGVSK